MTQLRVQKNRFTRRKILLVVVCCVLAILVIEGMLYARSTYGVRQFTKIKDTNRTVIVSTTTTIKTASSTGIQHSLAGLSTALQEPQGASCEQNDTYMFVTVKHFKDHNESCQTYTKNVKAAKSKATQLAAMGAYSNDLVEALKPVMSADSLGADPTAAVDAYAKAADRVSKLQHPSIWQKQHEALVAKLKQASADAAAVAEAQKIQSVDGFCQKSEAMQKTVIAMNAIGAEFYKGLIDESTALQTILNTLS